MRMETERQGALLGLLYEQKWWLEQQHEWPRSVRLLSQHLSPHFFEW